MSRVCQTKDLIMTKICIKLDQLQLNAVEHVGFNAAWDHVIKKCELGSSNPYYSGEIWKISWDEKDKEGTDLIDYR